MGLTIFRIGIMPDREKDKISLEEIRLMKESKAPVQSFMREVAELIYPSLMDMGTGDPYSYPDVPRHYSSTARTALQMMAQGLCATFMNPDNFWFELGEFGNKAVMENNTAKQWFDDVRRIINSELYNDGFFDVIIPAIKTAAGLGTSLTTALEANGRINYIQWHPRSVMIGEDDGRRVDRLAITTYMTLYNLYERGFKLTDREETEIRGRARADRKENEVVFYYHRVRKDEKNLDNNNKWRLVVLNTLGEVYHTSEMRGLPGAVWRFFPKTDSPYGEGPGTNIFRDMLQANKIQRLLLQDTEKRINPPMFLPRLNRAYLSPGSENYPLDANNPNEYPRPMFVQGDVAPSVTLKNEIDNIIELNIGAQFFTQLMELDGKQTAEQIRMMSANASSLVFSFVDTFERNWVVPMLRRTMVIMYDQGKLPEAPNIIRNKGGGILEMRFIGPIAKARRYYFSLKQDNELFQSVFGVAQVNPESLDYIRWPEYFSRLGRFMSGNSDIIATKEEVLQKRMERQRQQKLEEQARLRQAAITQGSTPEAGSPADSVQRGMI